MIQMSSVFFYFEKERESRILMKRKYFGHDIKNFK